MKDNNLTYRIVREETRKDTGELVDLYFYVYRVDTSGHQSLIHGEEANEAFNRYLSSIIDKRPDWLTCTNPTDREQILT